MRRRSRIVDIGSNSVRLVAYEGLSRAPRQIFNEKVALRAWRGRRDDRQAAEERHRQGARRLAPFPDVVRNPAGRRACMFWRPPRRATPRTAPNSWRRRREAIGAPIALLSGAREAELSAHRRRLGNPSARWRRRRSWRRLARTDRRQGRAARQGNHPAARRPGPDGRLRTIRRARRSRSCARRLAQSRIVERVAGRTFYAVGGTWRALAKLHMRQRHYPLTVMHGYVIPAQRRRRFRRASSSGSTPRR